MKNHLKTALLALTIAAIGIAFAGRDGSGTYSLPSGNPVSTGTTISSTWANTTLADIATALSNSIAKDGQTVPTANLPMGTFKHTNVATATARNHYAAASQVQDFSLQTLGSVSGTNTITGNLNPAITAYSAGMLITFQPANTNSGAATLNINSVGARPILKADGDALVSGDLVADVPAVLAVDGGVLKNFYLLNPQSANLINGVAISDLARLSQGNTFEGVLILSALTPDMRWNETDAAANNRLWGVQVSGEQLLFRVYNDAVSSAASFITIDRTANTVDSINLQATAVQVNGVAIPRQAFGLITESGAACSISGSDASSGIASVSYAAVPGRCNLTFNAGFTTKPICTATPNTIAGTRIAQVNCASSTACTLYQNSDFTTAASGQSNVSCVGT